MPAYDYICLSCKAVTEMYHGMHEHRTESCSRCGSMEMEKQYSCPRVIVPGGDLHLRNGGRGEYLGQLAARPDVKEPDLYYKSQREGIELAKRKTNGMAIIEK